MSYLEGLEVRLMTKSTEQGSWTDEQWQAIISRNKDILVAAAAGSGKTAVLVERIIRRITDEVDGVDIDQLLVVTFTNAAAAEMRHRISGRVEKALKENPTSIKLQRQLALINKAAITTLHSFCLDVVRKFYYLIDIDPKFRIAEDTETVLLQEEALAELFESKYSDEANTAFYDLVDCYANDRTDNELQELVLKLYHFSRSHPSPSDWLDGIADNYDVAGVESLDDLPWIKDFMLDIQLQLQGIRCLLENSIQLAYQPEGPAPYIEALQSDIEQVDKLLAAARQSWEQLAEAFQSLSFMKLKVCKKGTCDESLKEQAKELRDKAKVKLNDLKAQLFTRDSKQYLQDILRMEPHVSELVELVKQFAEAYQQLKAQKGLVDFADLEHYCLQILQGDEAKQQFVEILIDEYQDTNLVQEMILQLVKSDNNYLFMVGDVKQSIYRFRLAEPELFLSKYKDYKGQANREHNALCIDLSRNFRSRKEVIDGTNFIFKQVMDETVGEIAYDEQAELIHGATYYPEEDINAELLLIGRTAQSENDDLDDDVDSSINSDESDENPEDLQMVQLEARVIAKQINELIGKGDKPIYQVYDKALANHDQPTRNVQFRDIVILLRATSGWAQVMLEELKQQGIPAYADLTTGYFSATEVNVMMSLLKVIDNPYQDIPLAAVLRSPIVGLTGDQLANIRLYDRHGAFYDAVKAYIAENETTISSEEAREGYDVNIEEANKEDVNKDTENIDAEIFSKLVTFNQQLQSWRTAARQGALSDLIWQIYRQTGYYDFVGGMVSGNQRQANLRALYDRARGYEQTSFRGLFRFLRFIEHMQDRGRDLGTARALGEQEDVVRIMTIHKSKGLEFPIVFVAGLGKKFNLQDVQGKYLIHKKMGFGTALIDPKQRVSYPMLSQLAIRQRVKMEQLAEEMRVLYVALTRAREKLFLLATVKDLEKEVNRWSQQLSLNDWILPDYERASGKRFIDWIGAAIIRHRHAQTLHERAGIYCDQLQSEIFKQIHSHRASWQITYYNSAQLIQANEIKLEQDQVLLTTIENCQPILLTSNYRDRIYRQLEWEYPYQAATKHLSKQTVSGIKRDLLSRSGLSPIEPEANILIKPIIARPRFMQDKSLTAAERGTVMHLIMQHVNLESEITVDSIREQINRMVANELLTSEQVVGISPNDFVAFYKTDLGKRLLSATMVEREIPFSLGVDPTQIYPDWQSQSVEERVLIQGIVDCIFEDEQGLVLLDYKSDRIRNLTDEQLVQRYQLQMDLYCQAIEAIWKKQVDEKYLFFFDELKIIKLL